MVAKGKRKTGKFAVETKVDELLSNTYSWISNDKIIPKKHKFTIGADIKSLTLEVHNYIYQANATRSDVLEEFSKRLTLEQLAMNKLEMLISIVNMAFTTFNIKESTCNHWSKLLSELKKLLGGWIESDRIRFNKLANNKI